MIDRGVRAAVCMGSPPGLGGLRPQPGRGSLVLCGKSEPPRQAKRLPPLLRKEGSFFVDTVALAQARLIPKPRRDSIESNRYKNAAFEY